MFCYCCCCCCCRYCLWEFVRNLGRVVWVAAERHNITPFARKKKVLTDFFPSSPSPGASHPRPRSRLSCDNTTWHSEETCEGKDAAATMKMSKHIKVSVAPTLSPPKHHLRKEAKPEGGGGWWGGHMIGKMTPSLAQLIKHTSQRGTWGGGRGGEGGIRGNAAFWSALAPHTFQRSTTFYIQQAAVHAWGHDPGQYLLMYITNVFKNQSPLSPKCKLKSATIKLCAFKRSMAISVSDL